MERSAEIETFDDALATFWFDKDGILNVVTKPVTRTLENTQVLIKHFKQILSGKMVYVISDLTPIGEINEEAREYYKKELPHLFKAMALFSSTPLGRMVGSVINLVFDPSVPTKIFEDESDARAWLKGLQAGERAFTPRNPGGKKAKGKIILVDDEPFERDLMEYALKDGRWQLQIQYFSNAIDALSYLKDTRDDIFLIISDINMPRMNGFEFKKAMDADKYLAQKAWPFIFSSSSATKEDVVQAYDNRIQGYFQKPSDNDEASEMLDKIFNYWSISRHPEIADL